MDTRGLYISFSRALRSFILTILAFSSPYFLVSHGLNYIEVGVILLFSAAFSTIFIYAIPSFRLPVRSRIVISWALFSLSLILLLIFQSVLGYLLAILTGGLSLSGKDMSANQPIEQYAIGSFYTDQKTKNIQFSYYNFLSYGGNALAAGLVIIFPSISFSSIFLLCAVLGLLSGVPYLMVRFPEPVHSKSGIILSEEARRLRNRLGALFGLDAFGGGFVSTSMIALWFLAVFSVPLSVTGYIFVVVNILTAISVIISGRISSRYGLIRTMVASHLISNSFLILMSVFHILIFAEIFLFLRQTTSQMDVSPRDSFINTVIDANSRVKTNSQFLAIRNASTIPAPAVGGELLATIPQFMPAVSGIIKSVYDLSLYVLFRNYKI
ncbi:MAG: MFS transporter [Candidatus Thermoplasmatota archaeon]|nr:MFS transporter [Candidatus Thermoplasmatota archaeon]